MVTLITAMLIMVSTLKAHSHNNYKKI